MSQSKLKRINKDEEIDEQYGPCECPKENFVNYTKYYDTPDGCDVFKKIQVVARYGILTGLVISTYDVLMYSHAVGLGNILSRYLVHTVPLGLMGATFAAVANGSQLLRDKDDALNYFLGGLACGPLAGYYLRSRHAVLLGGLALGVVGALKKKAVEEGHIFSFSELQPHMGTVNGWRHDYTLSHDPKDDWMKYCSSMSEEDKKKKNKKKKYCLDDWVTPTK